MAIKRVTQAGFYVGIIVSLILVLIACSNAPPVISRISLDNSSISVSSINEVRCDATDPDGDELVYTWSVTGGNITSMSPVATWVAPDKPGLYSITVSVRDSQNKETVDKMSVLVFDNLPPVIYSLLIEPSAVGAGLKGTLTCQAYDPEGDELQYQYEAENGELSGSGEEVVWTAPFDEKVSTIKVNVTDREGGLATMSINVNILPNHSPEIESVEAQPRSLKSGAVSTVKCLASDIDGDELTYYWEASGGVIAGDGAQVAWTAPENCAKYDISVTARDGRGGEATKKLQLTVSKTGG